MGGGDDEALCTVHQKEAAVDSVESQILALGSAQVARAKSVVDQGDGDGDVSTPK